MSETTEETAEEVLDTIDETGFGLAAWASIASVALALFYYYVRGDKQRGQFVGLWPATILGLAAYLRLGEIKQLLQEAEN
ncbi:hypothetical protein [Halovenus amylolytica]|uniref:hypothetical protein n=1 Tax=Halovenus amylolytica TaxID=2500550 RepID=UPI003622E984